MDTTALPKEVRALLAWWMPPIQSILGEKITSVVLYGGVTLGDFVPAWSDIDVCVVLDNPVSQGEGLRIGRVHDEMQERFVHQREGGWKSGQVIEGLYIPLEIATHSDATDLCYIAGTTVRKLAECNPVSPFDRYMLAHSAVCYFGERASFVPPKRESLVRQLREDLQLLTSERDECLNSSIWLAGLIHWIARAIVFWRDGVMVSKTVALKGEIEAGSPFSEAYRLALRLREQGSQATEAHLGKLRKNFLLIAQPAADLLKKLVEEGV